MATQLGFTATLNIQPVLHSNVANNAYKCNDLNLSDLYTCITQFYVSLLTLLCVLAKYTQVFRRVINTLKLKHFQFCT